MEYPSEPPDDQGFGERFVHELADALGVGVTAYDVKVAIAKLQSDLATATALYAETKGRLEESRRCFDDMSSLRLEALGLVERAAVLLGDISGSYCGYDHAAAKCPMPRPDSCFHHQRNAWLADYRAQRAKEGA